MMTSACCRIKRARTMHGSTVAGLLVAWTGAAIANPTPRVTAADYARAETFLVYATAPKVLNAVENATWLPSGRLWYRATRPGGHEFVLLDPAHAAHRTVFPESALTAALSTGTPFNDYDSRYSWRGFKISGDGSTVSFDAASTHWTCELPTRRCLPSEARDEVESLSPDRSEAAFIRDHNLWVRDVRSGAERQLTRDGAADFGYATDNPGWEHGDHPVLTWSPDSTKIATFQQDQRGVGEMYLVATRLGHPQLESWKYPMAGDETVATIQRVIIDTPSGRVVRLDMPPDAHRSSPCYDVQCTDHELADAQWSSDGAHLAFVSTSRDHKQAVLREADAGTGAVRTVLEERVPTYYESDNSSTTHGAVNWRYLPSSREVVWFSERDDHAHLYLYDLRGRLRHRITGGDWNVVEVLHVDEKRRLLYFTAVGREPGRDPYFLHLYRVGLDGRGLALLTPENANHDVLMSPSGEFFLDSYSTPDTAPVTVLRDRTGKLVSTLETTDITALRSGGWKPPVRITVKARDGATDLYGLMFTPTTFDPDKQYPIIDWVYPGPQTGSVGSRSFSASRGDRQALAELGFIVVEIDGMGTPYRSKKFHDADYGDLRDNTLPDQVAAMRELARRYPWIDLARAGIYGHSGGGYAAAAAMFLYPDFFKVGVSESGNHDQRGYTDDWGEKFIGLLQRGPRAASPYDHQDTESLAQNLKGHLLLMHGTLDDNVPPYLTLLVVDSLIKANKDFDLLMLPNQRHYYEGQSGIYAMRRRWDYFVRYLRGAEPPHEYEMHWRSGDASFSEF